MCGVDEAFSFPIVPRYAEVDQQGVVFNGHYLTWFDEASYGFFDHLGVRDADFTAWQLDLQVVHAEIDYFMPVRWRDRVRVEARGESVGTTSFALRFDVLRRNGDGVEVVAARGRNVYVVVSTTDWAKREVPPGLRGALTSLAGQGRNATPGGTVTP
ncbi:MAG: thioesterase family protein [Mycobacterium sp.]